MGTSKRGTEFNTFYAKHDDGSYRYWTTSSYTTLKTPHCVKIWRVGLKGGVKVVHNRTLDGPSYGYVTKNPKEMEEFMWAKLAATHGPL
jgi:hypothetical protein